ncbi:MAG: hypothetical protein ACI9BO_001144 [Zhongshania sp.]|jgi:hypothetical protein
MWLFFFAWTILNFSGALLAFLGLVLLSGCATRMVDFTIISTKNVDLARLGEFHRSERVERVERVEGVDTRYIIIIIPTGNPSVEEAVDRAIESVPGGVALIDGVLTSKFFYIPYIFGETKYVVTGTVLIDPKLVSNTRASTHEIIELDAEGSVSARREVSSADYDRYLAEISRASAGVESL